MSGQIVAFAPATRVASRKLGPVAGTSAVAEGAGGLGDEHVREDVRQVRDARHHAVVVGGVDRRRLRADPGSVTVQALVERARGGRARRQVPGRAVEQVGARVLDARGLGAGERVPADEARIVAWRTIARLVEPTSLTRSRRAPRRAPRRALPPSALTGRRRTRARPPRPRRPTLDAARSRSRHGAAPLRRVWAVRIEADDARAEALARAPGRSSRRSARRRRRRRSRGVNALPASAAARSTCARVLGELVGAQRLRAVADRLVRVGMHLDDDPVGAGGRRPATAARRGRAARRRGWGRRPPAGARAGLSTGTAIRSSVKR
jgi:hypothetical protein